MNVFSEEKLSSKERNLLVKIKKLEMGLQKNFSEEEKNLYNEISDLITHVQILEEERLVTFILNILFR